MSIVIRETEFIKVSLVKVEHKEINEEAVKKSIVNYLSENLISGDKFEFYGFQTFSNSEIEFELKRLGEDLYNNGYVDEDFETDESFTSFCEEMESKLEVRRFSVPYWYYPK